MLARRPLLRKIFVGLGNAGYGCLSDALEILVEHGRDVGLRERVQAAK